MYHTTTLQGKIPASSRLRSRMGTHIFDRRLRNLHLGTALVVLYIMQYVLSWKLEWLLELQARSDYKQVSGFLILFYFILQWRIVWRGKTRSNGAKNPIRQHASQGMLAPVLLYLHSADFGFAYQTLFCFLFLLHYTIALLHFPMMASKHTRYRAMWLSTHIILAILLMCLITYHLYVVYTYH